MGVPGLRISELADGQVLVLAIDGEIAAELRDAALEAALRAVRRCTRCVIADLSRARRVSSALAGLLAYYAKSFPTQGRALVAVRAPAGVQKFLTPTGVDRLVPFFDTIETALEQVGLAQAGGVLGATSG